MRELRKICVVGGGVMGREIALNAAFHGYRTVLIDTQQAALDKAAEWAARYLQGSVDKGKVTEAEKAAALGRISYQTEVAGAVTDADLVIESIVEQLEAKLALFAMLNECAPPETLLVTNSSYIPSSRLAGLVKNAGRVANLHYFNPAMRMELVEIVRGPHTDLDTVNRLAAFAESIGKTAVLVCKEVEGFLVNRLVKAVANEAFFLLENGVASFRDIDMAAEKGLKHPMGPFRLMDFTGLDITYLNRRRVYEETGEEFDKPPAELAERYARGEFGRKTGKGWYDYPAE